MYTWTEFFFFYYDTYVKNKPYKSCKRSFCHKYPSVRVPAQFSMTTAWIATKKLYLLPYKIKQIQVIEEGNYKRTHFYNRFFFVDST
jgi:hypothetical protein